MPGTSLDYVSAACHVRGKVYDALENFPRALHWYKLAIHRDPFNVEAFEALVGGHKLSEEEEISLVTGIIAALPEEHRWLGLLYRGKCSKYDESGRAAAEQALDALENESPNPRWSPAQSQSHSQGDQSMHAAPPSASTSLGKASRRAMPATTSGTAISPIKEESSEGRSPSPWGSGIRTTNPAEGEMPPALGSSKHDSSEGWGLGSNADVVACRAEALFRRGRFAEAHSLTAAVLERDPYCEAVLPVHLAAAVQLQKKHELFALGHRLIEAHPERALPWYAAGCYYFVTCQYGAARQYLSKATKLQRGFAPAWLGFAAAFAARDETDQAMAAYRKAARLFPGLHSPALGMGLEYARMNNLPLAEQMLLRAHQRCPADPAVSLELGTVAHKSGRYQDAVEWLTTALVQIPDEALELKELGLVNLGHTLRKLRRWNEALFLFEKALGIAPGRASTLAVMGYTYHLSGRLSPAIEYYHKALGLRGDDYFVAQMLSIAIAEESEIATAKLASMTAG